MKRIKKRIIEALSDKTLSTHQIASLLKENESKMNSFTIRQLGQILGKSKEIEKVGFSTEENCFIYKLKEREEE